MPLKALQQSLWFDMHFRQVRVSSSADTSVFDSSPPVITNVTPASGSNIHVTSSITFDVLDVGGEFRRIFLVAHYGGTNAVKDLIHDGDNFGSNFLGVTNTRTTVAAGFRYVVLRDGGWPAGTGSLGIYPYAIDTRGNQNA